MDTNVNTGLIQMLNQDGYECWYRIDRNVEDGYECLLDQYGGMSTNVDVGWIQLC